MIQFPRYIKFDPLPVSPFLEDGSLKPIEQFMKELIDAMTISNAEENKYDGSNNEDQQR